MKGFRVSILDVMSLVVIAAIDCAIVKRLMDTSAEATGFAFGILPLASLLIFLVFTLIPRRMRSHTPLSFLAGFECFGWIAIPVFVVLLMIYPDSIDAYLDAAESKISPGKGMHGVPDWLRVLFVFGFCTIVFTTPELLFALFGGWLTRKLGITVLIERKRGERHSASTDKVNESTPILTNTSG